MPAANPDYLKYYYLEGFLIEEVGSNFRDTGEINPDDFFLILIWKSPRAKTKHKARLEDLSSDKTFQAAVSAIAQSLHNEKTDAGKLRILMQNWKFYLPTATAILTILYPESFTVYDIRVCNELHDFHSLSGKTYSDKLWKSYQEFRQCVEAAAPGNLSLRDKDRWLWAKSLCADVRKSINA